MVYNVIFLVVNSTRDANYLFIRLCRLINLGLQYVFPNPNIRRRSLSAHCASDCVFMTKIARAK